MRLCPKRRRLRVSRLICCFFVNSHPNISHYLKIMKRRDFLELCAAMAVAPFVPGKVLAAFDESKRPRSVAPLNIKNITV